jgi:hypothetical protein
MDVVYALKKNGRVIYGYGAWFLTIHFLIIIWSTHWLFWLLTQ